MRISYSNIVTRSPLPRIGAGKGVDGEDSAEERGDSKEEDGRKRWEEDADG